MNFKIVENNHKNLRGKGILKLKHSLIILIRKYSNQSNQIKNSKKCPWKVEINNKVKKRILFYNSKIQNHKAKNLKIAGMKTYSCLCKSAKMKMKKNKMTNFAK